MRDLNHEFSRLNESQRKGVEFDGNVAVLAGPGSGKTATLVIKVAHLQTVTVVPPAGIACITFNNDAVREIKNRFGGEGTSDFDDRNVLNARYYERALDHYSLIDFGGMVGLGFQFIRDHDWIRSVIVARFPWLIVDEYQDLGGPLHAIVTTLMDRAGMNVFAVGDPDQTIYDFTGADPRYLKELSERADFKSIRLRFNYRSGRRLIAAGQAALSPEEPREYEPDPERTDQGE